jgi:hypothetical protein
VARWVSSLRIGCIGGEIRHEGAIYPGKHPVIIDQALWDAGHCRCCGGVTLAPVPTGLEDTSPFSVNIVALAIYLRFTHAISYRRLTQLFLHLFALRISEGALDALWRRAKPCLDNEVAAILARCAAHGSFAPTKRACGWTDAPIGTGFSRTIRR